MSVINKIIETGKKPRLVVFDLDYTLWSFWCDTHVRPPFRRNSNGILVDQYNFQIKTYGDVVNVLKSLKSQDISIAAASRTETPRVAETLLKLLDLDHYFSFKEIYPGSKVKHFSNFHRDSKFEYREMIFFDDEQRNIHEISKLGVTCQYVDNGLTVKDFEVAFRKFRATNS